MTSVEIGRGVHYNYMDTTTNLFTPAVHTRARGKNEMGVGGELFQ